VKNINKILFLFSFLLASFVSNAQDFPYNSNKNCGKYEVGIFVNDIAQNKNSQVVIEVDNFSEKIDLTIVVQKVKFGYDRRCENLKKKKHKDEFFLELSKGNITNMQPEGFKKLNVKILRIGETGNKSGIEGSQKITYQLDKSTIKSDIENKILLGFNVSSFFGVKGSFEVLIDYKIIKGKNASKIEDKDLATISGIQEKDPLDSVILFSKNIAEKDLALDVTSFGLENPNNKERIAWDGIIKNIKEKDWAKVESRTWIYRTQFKDGPHYEEAWYYSVLYADVKSEKELLCNMYFKEFPEGVFYERVEKECNSFNKKKARKKNNNENKDLAFWEKKVLPKNERSLYKKYLSRFGDKDALYAKEAIAKIENFALSEKSRFDTDTSMIINIAFSGNEQKQPIIEVLEGQENLLDTIQLSILGGRFNLKFDQVVRLSFSIEGSPWKKDTIELDAAKPPFFAEWKLDNITKIAELTNIENVVSPLEIELINIDGDEIVARYFFNKIEKSVKIGLDTIGHLTTANYKLRVRDKSKVNSFISEELFIEKSDKSKLWKFVVGFSILAIFFALLLYRKRNSENEVHQKVNDNITTSQPSSPESKKEVFATTINNPASENGSSRNSSIRKRIKIHGMRANYNEIRAMSMEDFSSRTSAYLPIMVSELWSDSRVSKILINDNCLEAIDDFVFKRMQEHRLPSGEVPEVGGFLLGSYSENNGKYLVSLQKFIDIESEESGVYQISFGAKAWSKLENEMADFENSTYGLVGWFHTHPGHGLFLSPPDLNIHKNFFRKPFQIAMEIDSVLSTRNQKYDVAFFTQKKSGEINNFKDLENSWFQWEDLKNIHQ